MSCPDVLSYSAVPTPGLPTWCPPAQGHACLPPPMLCFLPAQPWAQLRKAKAHSVCVWGGGGWFPQPDCISLPPPQESQPTSHPLNPAAAIGGDGCTEGAEAPWVSQGLGKQVGSWLRSCRTKHPPPDPVIHSRISAQTAQSGPTGQNPSLDPFLCLLAATNSPSRDESLGEMEPAHVISSTQQTAGL